MRNNLLALVVASLLALYVPARAADAPAKHRVMFFEYGNTPNRLIELDEDGKIVLEYKPPSVAVWFQVLPNSNILLGYGGSPTGVMEIDRAGKTVWNYVAKCAQVFCGERLPNGNTLVAEQGPCQTVEVDPAGQIVHTTPMQTTEVAPHRQLRTVHKLKNGNILACHEGEGAVREYDPDGKVVWELKGIDNTGAAIRLDNGNTVVCGATQKRLIEVNPKGEVVWEFKAEDAPELNITWVASVQILDNGNFLVDNFLRGQEGKGVHAFEVTRDKKVVWTFADHTRFRSLTTFRYVDEKK